MKASGSKQYGSPGGSSGLFSGGGRGFLGLIAIMVMVSLFIQIYQVTVGNGALHQTAVNSYNVANSMRQMLQDMQDKMDNTYSTNQKKHSDLLEQIKQTVSSFEGHMKETKDSLDTFRNEESSEKLATEQELNNVKQDLQATLNEGTGDVMKTLSKIEQRADDIRKAIDELYERVEKLDELPEMFQDDEEEDQPETGGQHNQNGQAPSNQQRG